ncbi:DNA primase [Rodentibacter caecimuris]|uniref:DNA primase n=1 Tax=Rodentibacter caecimuris TaxID=1796644 RepID=A0A9X8YXD1_9PAST|nr:MULTISPECIES: DNA primase [Pasteurellaceae]AOF52803.1 DNA primase [Pasteurellaceae bacterium NI1060]MCR1838264.1 DNA primase [Pasteurella caecimuris]MCU0107388.1 DNA primase [Pasteurella caecimuris]OOF71550.1 DNA primase [Rodentibacter heylii]OOF73883.1 DNA primase [Rodentibacter heylii]
MKGLIPRPFIDDLLTKSNIIDVINSRIKLKKAGRDYQACCPFHHEKTPSFTVSEKKQFYHCFGCGAHGNAISFLMDYDKLEFVEAIEELAAMAGLEVPYEKRNNSANQRPQANYQTKRNLYELMQEIAKFYQAQLPLNIPAQSYLQQRGLSAEVIERFQIGFVPNAMDSVLRKFAVNREEQQKLLDLGMLSRNDRGNIYDKFRNRIMFPIRDKRGRTVAFGGRVLGDEKPKYLNSPETITYHKGNELYGLYEALQMNDEPQKLLVVEGYMDVVALAQFGVDYAVASLGTSTTSEQIQLLFRSTEQVICCYDGDRAGRDAAWRALENALPYLEDGRQIKFIFLPDGEDPDTYVRQYGKAKFEEYIESAQSLTEFLFAHLNPQVDFSTKEGRSKLVALAVPLIRQIPGEALRLSLRNTLAQKLGIFNESQLESLIPKQVENHKVKRADSQPKIKQTPMRVLISLLLQNTYLVNRITESGLVALRAEAGYDLLEKLTALCRAREGITVGQILEYFRDTEYSRPLEILATWEHLLDDTEIINAFSQNYRRLNIQAIERNIEMLIAKERAEGLTEQEREMLVTLLTSKEEQKKQLVNPQ